MQRGSGASDGERRFEAEMVPVGWHILLLLGNDDFTHNFEGSRVRETDSSSGTSLNLLGLHETIVVFQNQSYFGLRGMHLHIMYKSKLNYHYVSFQIVVARYIKVKKFNSHRRNGHPTSKGSD
jgi:hypothetical protein